MRVGMLTSGGDCQSLNATMRGVAKTLYNQRKDVEIIGFIEGYRGLIYEDYRIMKSKDFSGILTNGGTILGTSRQPFKLMRVPDENGLDKVEAMKNTYKKLKLDCLVVLGGNGRRRQIFFVRKDLTSSDFQKQLTTICGELMLPLVFRVLSIWLHRLLTVSIQLQLHTDVFLSWR